MTGFNLSTVIPGCATWRRPGIHTPGRGYGFRARSLCSRPGMTSKRPATIDEMRDAGRERAFVAGKIDRKRRDFLGRAEPSHRLPAHEHVAASRTRGGRAVQHRGRLDGAGANTITSYALGDEIGGDRAGQRGDGGFG